MASENGERKPEPSGESRSVCERIHVSVIVSLRLTSSDGVQPAKTALRNPQHSVCSL